MTSGERISQLHDVARPGELRKGLRLVDDLQTYPPVFTGRTSSNTPGANGGRSSSHSRTAARGIGRCASSSRVGTTNGRSSRRTSRVPCLPSGVTHASPARFSPRKSCTIPANGNVETVRNEPAYDSRNIGRIFTAIT